MGIKTALVEDDEALSARVASERGGEGGAGEENVVGVKSGWDG